MDNQIQFEGSILIPWCGQMRFGGFFNTINNNVVLRNGDAKFDHLVEHKINFVTCYNYETEGNAEHKHWVKILVSRLFCDGEYRKHSKIYHRNIQNTPEYKFDIVIVE